MSSPPLSRRLTTSDAVVVALSSMMGAGVFAVFAPAAAAAGGWLLVGLAIAAVVAFCNALSSAQLAAQYPTSGGSYVYGRERLGPWPGFLAGWTFVIGKTASCAATALTFGSYAAPDGLEKPLAAVAVLGLTAVNCVGITRTAGLARVIVGVVLAVLAIVAVAGAVDGFSGSGLSSSAAGVEGFGVLQSAGLLFFAFAGYARVATLGEEVRDPARAIPRAIVIALSITLVVYTLVAVTALGLLGPDRLAESTRPLADTVLAAGWPWAVPVVAVGAAAASLGALLSLIAGVGRTTLAMARGRDLPSWLGAVHPRFAVPHHAEITVALVVTVLVFAVDLRAAIGFSSFGVLLYYLVANLAAFTQHRSDRRYPRAVQIVGAIGCVVLTATLPLESIVGGVIVLGAGAGFRLAVLRLRREP